MTIREALLLIALSEWEVGNGLGRGVPDHPLGTNPSHDEDYYRKDLDATARMLADHYFDGDEDAELMNTIVRQKSQRHGRDPRTVEMDLMGHPAVYPRYKKWLMDGSPHWSEMDYYDAGLPPTVPMPEGWTPTYRHDEVGFTRWQDILPDIDSFDMLKLPRMRHTDEVGTPSRGELLSRPGQPPRDPWSIRPSAARWFGV